MACLLDLSFSVEHSPFKSWGQELEKKIIVGFAPVGVFACVLVVTPWQSYSGISKKVHKNLVAIHNGLTKRNCSVGRQLLFLPSVFPLVQSNVLSPIHSSRCWSGKRDLFFGPLRREYGCLIGMLWVPPRDLSMQ